MRASFLSLTSVAAVVACASTQPVQQAPLVVPLAATQYNAGSVGHATLLPDAAGTRIELFFTAAGPYPTLPVHVYTYLYEGTCEALPPVPAFSLNRDVLVRNERGDIARGRRGAFNLSHSVPLPLSELAGGRYALALRSAPADGGAMLYCGDLRGAA